MARYTGTRAPSVQGFGSSGQTKAPSPFQMKSGGVRFDGAAADAVSVGSIFGGLRAASPKYADIAATGEKLRAEERIANWSAQGEAVQAGIGTAGNIAAAEKTAEGMKAQGAAQEKAGLFSAIGGIATAAIGLSDETTKHTIDKLENACGVLRELNPVSFYYKEEYSSSPERMHYGFIAQEYQKVMPDATYYDESIGKLCIDTTELISLLVRANQELQSRVSRMEAKQALVSV